MQCKEAWKRSIYNSIDDLPLQLTLYRPRSFPFECNSVSELDWRVRTLDLQNWKRKNFVSNFKLQRNWIEAMASRFDSQQTWIWTRCVGIWISNAVTASVVTGIDYHKWQASCIIKVWCLKSIENCPLFPSPKMLTFATECWCHSQINRFDQPGCYSSAARPWQSCASGV